MPKGGGHVHTTSNESRERGTRQDIEVVDLVHYVHARQRGSVDC